MNAEGSGTDAEPIGRPALATGEISDNEVPAMLESTGEPMLGRPGGPKAGSSLGGEKLANASPLGGSSGTFIGRPEESLGCMVSLPGAPA
jgi:hypothetical protein